jgi:uncharacterized protein with ParB-like and HNH nuclease domain
MDKYLEREQNTKAIKNILSAVEGYAQHLDITVTADISISSTLVNNDINLPVFVPLDGQQRLTTLFLLHWYLCLFSDEANLQVRLNILSHFTYKTRKSSLEFCRAICQTENVLGLKMNGDKLSDAIQNSTMFRKTWMKDSTVKGMLVMLDEIDKQVKQVENKAELLSRLLGQKSSLITFDFLDLHELNQTDELYVKMNARGKQLSEFEHFKAWLQNYISVNNLNNLIDEKDWRLKFDRSWLDLFWQRKAPGVFQIDNVIYNAFKQIALFEYIASKGKSVDISLTKAVRDNFHIPFSYYDSHNFFSRNVLNF